jgi:hypothetical protein
MKTSQEVEAIERDLAWSKISEEYGWRLLRECADILCLPGESPSLLPEKIRQLQACALSEKQAKVERGDMLVEAQALVSERESRLTNIKVLLEPIYGSTNYAPIGGTIDRVLKICDL